MLGIGNMTISEYKYKLKCYAGFQRKLILSNTNNKTIKNHLNSLCLNTNLNIDRINDVEKLEKLEKSLLQVIMSHNPNKEELINLEKNIENTILWHRCDHIKELEKIKKLIESMIESNKK